MNYEGEYSNRLPARVVRHKLTSTYNTKKRARIRCMAACKCATKQYMPQVMVLGASQYSSFSCESETQIEKSAEKDMHAVTEQDMHQGAPFRCIDNH